MCTTSIVRVATLPALSVTTTLIVCGPSFILAARCQAIEPLNCAAKFLLKKCTRLDVFTEEGPAGLFAEQDVDLPHAVAGAARGDRDPQRPAVALIWSRSQDLDHRRVEVAASPGQPVAVQRLLLEGCERGFRRVVVVEQTVVVERRRRVGVVEQLEPHRGLDVGVLRLV